MEIPENLIAAEINAVNLTASMKFLFLSLARRQAYTALHSLRVTRHSLRFADHLRISLEDREALRIGGYLHDIGKIAIDDNALLKPGSLSREERALIESHPLIGQRLVKDLGLGPQGEDLILHHHERWDGRGYPDGLARDEIPLLCQILALADCYDALTTDRCYRRACTPAEALAEIRASSGTQFRSELAQEFIEMISSSSQLVNPRYWRDLAEGGKGCPAT